MRIGELFIALGFDVDDKKLREFDQNLKDTLGSMTKLSAGAGAALYGFNKFLEGSIATATALENFNTITDESIDSLQKWQVVATMKNTAMSVDQVTSSIMALDGAISDVAMGKGPSGAFSMLNIDVRGKTAFQVLEDMRRNFDENVKRWGHRQTVSLMMETGIDPGMVAAIRSTREEFDRIAEGRLLSPEAQQKLVELGQKIQGVEKDFKLFKDQLVGDWGPGLIATLNKLEPQIKDVAKNFHAVSDEVYKFAQSLDGQTGAAILGFFTILLARIYPVTAALTGLIWLTNEWGKHLRGEKDNYFDKPSDALTTDENGNTVYDFKKSPLGKFLTKALGDREENFRKMQDSGDAANGVDQNVINFRKRLEDQMRQTYELNMGGRAGYPPQPAPIQNQVQQLNTFHISGEFDADEVAREVAKQNQGMLDRTLNDFNNGPRF